jgi:hypothetical protein
MITTWTRPLILGLGLATASATTADALPIQFSAAGADPASIQPTVDAFRATLGVNNGNVAGSQPGGRREINWDGGGAAVPPTIAGSVMTNFAFRGNVNTTPGTGFEISGAPFPEFGDINPSYTGIFQTFSAPRLFAPLASNILDVLFTVPGTTDQPAVSIGFGAVFTDVDLGSTTSLQFFDADGNVLLSQSVLVANEGLSFLGVIFDDPVLARVRITLGNTALGPNDTNGVPSDVVVLDDFIYGEPQALLAVPEPAALALLGAGLLAVPLARRRKRH